MMRAIMSGSIPKRLETIKNLAKEYFPLERGSLIEKHTELLRVFDVRSSIHKKHPHKLYRVYISRRALKHCVESRKKDLSVNHTEEVVLANICFAIDKLQETIVNFDSYTYTPPNHIYAKNYSHDGKPFLRVVLEANESVLEIKSIHFRKNGK